MIKPISIALLVLLVIICMAEADPKPKGWIRLHWGARRRRNVRRRRRPVIRRRRRPVIRRRRRPVIRRRRRPVVLRRRRRPVVVARRRHTGGWGNGGWGNGNGGYTWGNGRRRHGTGGYYTNGGYYTYGHGPVHYHYHYPEGHGGYYGGNWGTGGNWVTTGGTVPAKPKPGRWSGWGRYGACSKKCGRGIQKRSRSCVGGTKCVGAKTQSRVCNAHACPLRYRNLGCYKDKGNRAIKGGHQNFPPGQAIRKCAEKARRLGNTHFAVQFNKECFTSRNAGRTYGKYGRAGGCKNGRGGTWRMNVYRRYDEPQDDDVDDGDALDDNDYEYDTSDE